MKKIALLLARFRNPFAVLMLIRALWMLIGGFIEKNARIDDRSLETDLLNVVN
jgi:hypothetical protein